MSQLHDARPLVLLGGMLADGSGEEIRPGNVLIHGDRIVTVGHFDLPADASIIDCTSLVVAPGFIDVHSHSDLQVLEGRREKLLQGVTSEVVGNCGFSAYPHGAHAAELRSFANGIFCGGDHWEWDTAGEYLADTGTEETVASVYSLIGHGSLRVAVAGNRMDALEEPLLASMEQKLAEAFEQGAIGFSTGLMYAPGSGAPASELERLCSVVAAHDKIYCTHMRDYGFYLLEAVDEQIRLAERTGCRLQISHLQAVGRPNRELNDRALECIEAAHERGVDVAFDCYPYIAGSTVMTQLLPQWALQGGTAGMLTLLAAPTQRARMEEEMLGSIANTWDELFVSAVGSERNAHAVGKSLEELGELRQQRPADVIFDLLLEERGQVNVLEFNQSEENLRRNLNHPLAIIISDGFYVKGRPHPRLHGTFPELLGNLCRDRQWMPLATAIHKITGLPSSRFGIAERGFLRAGYLADVTVFDPATIRSRATYTNPEQSPEGVHYVFREGRSLLEPASPA
ncbi:dihydroorotase/N-acyl-D-amino-acid deacylase [Granulicella aggregans]|uniref:Dihydroorotase/N-acyl-D-amino-acid deacylase n=1 Tax=Granulicella aggregans TaxID=474949 RepID=A0A7W7ZDU1_9BACT|nr:amidohydrolase family protein [Granulicella aggregans]MBB5057913.1 dihydroorotase/N-acyl-D-amino-acid deacylase [Granulicella aggregans]